VKKGLPRLAEFIDYYNQYYFRGSVSLFTNEGMIELYSRRARLIITKSNRLPDYYWVATTKDEGSARYFASTEEELDTFAQSIMEMYNGLL
jgi:hypothetical protein